MRTAAFMLALLAAPWVAEAQAQPPAGSIRPAPPAQPQGQMRGVGRGGWLAWPWGWWAGREERPAPKPAEPEPAARAWVENKDYQRPRLSPVMTDYTEGALPAPRAGTPGAVERVAPCRVVLANGEQAQAAWCEWRADSVRYADGLGRIVRVSIDLVDWTESTRPGGLR